MRRTRIGVADLYGWACSVVLLLLSRCYNFKERFARGPTITYHVIATRQMRKSIIWQSQAAGQSMDVCLRVVNCNNSLSKARNVYTVQQGTGKLIFQNSRWRSETYHVLFCFELIRRSAIATESTYALSYAARESASSFL